MAILEGGAVSNERGTPVTQVVLLLAFDFWTVKTVSICFSDWSMVILWLASPFL